MKKFSKFISFYTLLPVSVTLERICIGTTNLAITLPFTLDIKFPASRADRFFLRSSMEGEGIAWGRRTVKTAEEREY